MTQFTPQTSPDEPAAEPLLLPAPAMSYGLSHGGIDEYDPWPAAAAPRGGGGIGLGGIAEMLEVVALALVMFIAVRAVAQNFIVDGTSMAPTFENGELLIVNRLAYKSFDLSWIPGVDNSEWRPFGSPQTGDVVVFPFPQDPTRDFIKRVIGMPGQTVEIRDGLLYLDGVALDEDYIAEPLRDDIAPTVVPEGKVFVLGDNRNRSYDSQEWGMLDQSSIIGRADVRYWPFGRIGFVGSGSPTPALAGEVTSSR